jgi:hypothetical protein
MYPSPSVLGGPSSLKKRFVDRYCDPLSGLFRIFAASGSQGFNPD